MARQKRSPFEVKLTPEQEKELADRLSREVDEALTARLKIVGEDQSIDKWHKLYEGGEPISKDTPWPGAANLTSFIGTEKVDAWRSRVMATVFTEPAWIVEGWGDAAPRASLVEEFHQWKLEEERLQSYLGKVFHNSFVEGTGVLEVAERPQPRVIALTRQVAPMRLPDGTILVDRDGKVVPAVDEAGEPIPAQEGDPEAIPQPVTEVVNVGAGPQYRVVSLKDFCVFPGHASDVKDVWGYAKRVYLRWAQLLAREKAGVYSNVTKSAHGLKTLAETTDREQRSEDVRAGTTIALQEGDKIEKEIWEITFLHALADDGIEEWFVATLSARERVLLRLQRLVVGQPTYLLFTPLPRPNSVYGYSLIGHKLSTCIDEHTAVRNQIIDRSTMVNAAPLKRVIGSAWDPQESPWGPGQVIDVRDLNEVEAMSIPDVPGSMIERERNVLAAAERVSGLNDVALGVQPQQDRTLGEVNLVASQSFVRMEEAIRYIQEPLEQLFALRHELWKRALANGAEKLPPTMVAILEGRGVQVPNQEVDAMMLEGIFRGKPRASVEGADPSKMRQDFVGFLNSIANIARVVPSLQMQLNTPEAVQAILRQGMRVFGWKEPRALLGLNQMAAQGFAQIPNMLGMMQGQMPQGMPMQMPQLPPGPQQ